MPLTLSSGRLLGYHIQRLLPKQLTVDEHSWLSKLVFVIIDQEFFPVSDIFFSFSFCFIFFAVVVVVAVWHKG